MKRTEEQHKISDAESLITCRVKLTPGGIVVNLWVDSTGAKSSIVLFSQNLPSVWDLSHHLDIHFQNN